MPTIKMILLQETNEKRYNRKNIDGYIQDEIKDNPDTNARIEHGVLLVQEYMAKSYYASKNARIAQLANLDIVEVVTEIFVGVAYCLKEVLFTSITAQLAGRLHFNDKTDAIKTVAELVAVLCITDAFDINKADRSASLMLISRIQLSDQLIEYIENSEYLPPMVCIPKELKNNFSSGYLSHNESLILGGSANHHDGDLCLDVLNLMNAVPLQLDTKFISKVEERPTFELDTPDKLENWKRFKIQSYNFYLLMTGQGNQFYLTNKVDKRGRIYASGYHISTQGTSQKKAMIELANEELVEGVPSL